jgi:hypothetical protein
MDALSWFLTYLWIAGAVWTLETVWLLIRYIRKWVTGKSWRYFRVIERKNREPLIEEY